MIDSIGVENGEARIGMMKSSFCLLLVSLA